MDGHVPMIPKLVNTLVTCMMEPNCTDSVGTWILAMSRTVMIRPPLKMTIPILMTMIANWMNATCMRWMVRWFMF